MKPGWSYKPLPKVLLRVPSTKKIKKKEYLDSGKYPIISQEEGVVNGYWNDENDLIRLRRPIVIFGDHNQVVKYIDFDFVRGADGTKILDLIPELEPRFFYYFLLANPIEAIGYARHFRFVKELEVPFPPLEEQRRIVAVLDQAFEGLDRARANTEANLNEASYIFSNVLGGLFNQSKRGWKIGTVDEAVSEGVLAKPIDGNHGETHPKKSDFVSSGVPFIMASDLADGLVNQNDCYFITEDQAQGLRKGFSKSNDVLLSHKGTIGRVAKLKTDLKYVMLTPQVTYYRSENHDKLDPDYIYYFLQSEIFQKPLLDIARGGSTRAYIGITKQRSLPFYYPSKEEQSKLIKICNRIERYAANLYSTYEARLTELDDLRQSLLAKAFAGELT